MRQIIFEKASSHKLSLSVLGFFFPSGTEHLFFNVFSKSSGEERRRCEGGYRCQAFLLVTSDLQMFLLNGG